MPKKFILSEESVNDRGYRILTGGIDLERFKKNPVMLWMHRRDDGWGINQALPIGIWENIQLEGGTLTATPKFDENDKFAQLIQSKVENDLIRGCSIGVNPVEFSTDKKHLVKGQTRATITKCEIYEASIVDMPSNKHTVRLFSTGDTDNEVPLINFNTEMADKKDEKQLTFKTEADMLAFMKEKFGFEPKAETPEAKPEGFNFKSEDEASNWFQKLFGLTPKAKESEEKKEHTAENKEVDQLKTDLQAKETEMEELKAQIEKLKGAPGAKDKKVTKETDDKKHSSGDDSFETFAAAKSTWDAVNELMD